VVRNRADADRILHDETQRMDWILGDVLKTHGPHGLAPIMPDFVPAAPTGHPMNGSPYGLPYPAIAPGQPLPNTGWTGPEALPNPTPLPKETLPFPNGKEPLPLPMGGQAGMRTGPVSSARYPTPQQPLLLNPEPMQQPPVSQPVNNAGPKVNSQPAVNPGQVNWQPPVSNQGPNSYAPQQPAGNFAANATVQPPVSNQGPNSYYQQQPAASPAPNGYAQPQANYTVQEDGFIMPALPNSGQKVYPPMPPPVNAGQHVDPQQSYYPQPTYVPQQQGVAIPVPPNMAASPQQQGTVAGSPQGRKNEWLHRTP
jgi:hypothetical protein